MAQYKHGEMDTKVQEHTFDGFIKWVSRGSMVSIGILIFLALFNS